MTLVYVVGSICLIQYMVYEEWLILLSDYIISVQHLPLFSSSALSTNAFVVKEFYGFVEDMVVEDDPESTWKDYFRKPTKASHYQRVKSLHSLSAQVRSEIARKVFEAGGNAVLGYKVSLDMPSSSAIVARAHGTACKLYKVDEVTSILKCTSSGKQHYSMGDEFGGNLSQLSGFNTGDVTVKSLNGGFDMGNK